MMKNTWIFAGFLILLLSCKKDPTNNLYYWDQTKCADPWNTGEDDPNHETEVAITDYLNDNGIDVISIDFDNKSPINNGCESCGCGTGQRIIVEVEKNDGNAIEDLGFYK